MDYITKAVESVEGNLANALHELEELKCEEHKESVEDIVGKLREVIAELKAMKTE